MKFLKLLPALLLFSFGANAQQTLAIQQGGTGANTAAGALTSLGAQPLISCIGYATVGNISGTTGAPGCYQQIFLGTPAITDTGIAGQFTGSINNYYQLLMQNTNSGAAASTDIVLNNNLGTSTTYYANLGINSSNFTGNGSLNLPNASYLTSTSGDLVIGSTTANAVHFLAGGATTDAISILSSNLPVVNNVALGTSNQQIANTAFVAGTVAGYLPLTGGTLTGALVAPKINLAGSTSNPAWGNAGVGLFSTAATYTDTTSSGTVAADTVVNAFAVPTLSASSATTYTGNTATVYIAGPPTAGSGVTLSGSNTSMYIASGTLKLGSGQLSVASGGASIFGTVNVNNNGGTNTINLGTGTTTGTVLIGGPGNLTKVASQFNLSATAISTGAWNTNGVGFYTSAATYTDTTSTGTNANVQAIHSFAQPTIAATSATTYTNNIATVYIAGPPIAGTNATLSGTKYGLVVAAGGISSQGSSSFNSGGASSFQVNVGGSTGPITLGGTTNVTTIGNQVTVGYYADTSTSYQTFAAAGTFTLAQTVRKTININTATIATFTLSTAASPVDGQEQIFQTDGAITALTLTGTAGATVRNAPTTLTAGQKIVLAYRAATTTWYVSN